MNHKCNTKSTDVDMYSANLKILILVYVTVTQGSLSSHSVDTTILVPTDDDSQT